MAVVGIDLGTTNTVIAAVRDGRAAALKDQLGRALLPSVVSFSPKGHPKVGYEAKHRRTLDPENTVFSIKRLIGRSWESEHVQKALTRFPFELREGPGKGTLIRCQNQDHTLPEISALVLGRARDMAEQRLAQEVGEAVITVPANFNDLQRAATKVAGRVAGLEVLRILNEPTAAALAYGFGQKDRERIAVYDFGGGTFDVTLLDLSKNVFEVLSTAGDTFLGGDDLDEAIMLRMGEELLKKHKVDMEADNLVGEQLRAAAEKLKMDLSTRSMGRAIIEEIGFSGGKPVDFEFTLRRSEFEKLAEPFIERTLSVCQEALDVAGVTQKDLDQVLLVGGSTRIPLVRRRISSFFGKMPQSRLNPDEVVAIGAAIQAAALESKRGVDHMPQAPAPSPTAHSPKAETSGAEARGTKMGLPQPGRPPQQTLAGVGEQRPPMKTLSGVGEEPKDPSLGAGAHQAPANWGSTQGKGPKTLTGIGNPPSPEELANLRNESASLESPSPQSGRNQPGREIQVTDADLENDDEGPTGQYHQSSFDDITSVLPMAERRAKLQDREAAAQETHRTLLGTATPGPGQPLPPSPAPPPEEVSADNQGQRTEEGSVTFDLEELEAEAAAESTGAEQSSKPASIPPQAPGTPEALGSESDSSNAPEAPGPDFESEMGLPAVRPAVPLDQIEEVSGLLEMPDEDDSLEAELPSRAPPGVPEKHDLSMSSAEAADLPALSQKTLEQHQGYGDEPELPSPSLTPGRKGASDAAAPLDSEPSLEADEADNNAFSDERAATSPGPHDSRAELQSVDELEATEILGTLPPQETHGPLESVSDAQTDSTLGAAQMSPSAAGRGPAAAEVADQQAEAPWPPTPQGTPSSTEEPIQPPLLIDVTPLALGVETVGGFVEQLIPRNSPIPCQSTHTFTTARDQQQVVRVRVCQGDANQFAENTILGEVELTGLSPAPRGSVKIDVTFALDESGLLQVAAQDQGTGRAANARLRLVGLHE